jgi:hypothetical protein
LLLIKHVLRVSSNKATHVELVGTKQYMLSQ